MVQSAEFGVGYKLMIRIDAFNMGDCLTDVSDCRSGVMIGSQTGEAEL